MKSLEIRIQTGPLREVITSTEESNDTVSAVLMAINRLTKEQREQIIEISIYRDGQNEV